MTLGLEGLRAALAYANVLAVLRCVRHSESNNNEDGSAYWLLFGGTRAPSLAHHPRIPIMSPWGWTSAAGAYQAMAEIPGKVKTDTWDCFCRDMGSTPDEMPFNEETQDLFAVWCLRRRHALADAIAGRLDAVIDKCSYEWASWPPGRYGQPTTTREKLHAVYLAYGGTLADAAPTEPLIDTQPAAPIEDHSPQPETLMPVPLVLSAIAAFGPAIVEMIPAIAKLFDKSAETPAKLEAAQTVVQTLVKSTSSTNLQEAVEKMTADPVLRKAAEAAVLTAPGVTEYLEIGGGISAAREANLAAQSAPLGFWRNPAFWFVMVVVVPPLYAIVGALILRMPAPSEQLVTQVITAILGLAGVAGAYYLGSTAGSARKTEIIANKEQ